MLDITEVVCIPHAVLSSHFLFSLHILQLAFIIIHLFCILCFVAVKCCNDRKSTGKWTNAQTPI